MFQNLVSIADALLYFENWSHFLKSKITRVRFYLEKRTWDPFAELSPNGTKNRRTLGIKISERNVERRVELRRPLTEDHLKWLLLKTEETGQGDRVRLKICNHGHVFSSAVASSCSSSDVIWFPLETENVILSFSHSKDFLFRDMPLWMRN